MIYSYSIIGRRNSNEDQHHVFNNLSGKNKKYSKVAFYLYLMDMVEN